MKMRKIIAVMAAALMLLSILPMAVFAADTTIEFQLGADGTATHADGSSKTTYTETVDGYNLSVTASAQFYTGARDAKGNGCFKLGSSSKAGGFSFTVPDDVSSVVIAVAGYKANNAKISVNSGATQTISTLSNNGAYTDITVDTSSSKTVSFTTVSGGYRAMVNSITFVIPAAAGDCEHEWVLTGTTPANCTDAGEENYTCSLCSESKTETIDALGHAYGEATETVAPDCTNAGEKQSTCSVCGDVKTETVNALGHTFVDGFCSACGEAMPLEATITFDDLSKMTSSSTTQQVWEENSIVVTYEKNTYNNNLAEYANPVRFYAGTKVTIAYPGITKVVIVANTAAYAEVVKGGLPNSTVSGSTVTYECAAVDSVSFVPTAQARVNSITVYGSAPSDCDHNYVGVVTQAPTCTVEGLMTYTCSECGDEYTEAIAVAPHDYVEDIIPATCTATGTKTYECSVCFDSYDEVIPLAPHNYVDDVCADCGHVKVYKGTLVFDADKENRTEYSTQIQVWESEGVKLTNNKGESTTNVGDYGAPGRFYKSSTIIIEFPEMSKLIINADDNNNGDYAWDATLDAAGLSFTVENKIYTITFAEPTNSITLKTSNQVRAYSITAIVDHECVYDDNFDVDCNKCGDIREVEILTFNGKSASEDVAGLAFLFSVKADGVEIHENTQNTFKANSGEIEINGVKYTLKYAGAVLSNVADIAAEELTIANAQDNGNKNIKNIGAKYLWNYSENGFKYAIRIINIPEANWDTVISARPYYIYADAEGNSVIVYGDMQTGTYNATHG